MPHKDAHDPLFVSIITYHILISYWKSLAKLNESQDCPGLGNCLQ